MDLDRFRFGFRKTIQTPKLSHISRSRDVVWTSSPKAPSTPKNKSSCAYLVFRACSLVWKLHTPMMILLEEKLDRRLGKRGLRSQQGLSGPFRVYFDSLMGSLPPLAYALLDYRSLWYVSSGLQ